MKKEGYSEVLLNDFLPNSGVVGLLRIFRYTDDEAGGCKQGTDYIIDGQSIYIRNEFLLTQDMGGLFVQAMVHYLGSSTKYERVVDKQSVLNSLYAEPKHEDTQWQKSVDGIYKEFTDMLDTIQFLYRDIKGRRENLAPLFIIGGVYDRKSPYFEGRCKLIKNTLDCGILRQVIDSSDDTKINTLVGLLTGSLANTSEIAEKLANSTVDEMFSQLKEKVRAYYA